MAVPKRRQSSTRRDKRRTHDKAQMPAVAICPSCHEPVRPHNVCTKCGHYDGKKVLQTEE